MSGISKTFARLGEERVLVAYVMGGDPSIEMTPKVIGAVVEGGADIIEVGIPFSDPIADGRSIQASGVRALSAGATPSAILEIVADAKRRHGIPIAIMTYYNILYSRGLAPFLESAMRHEVDGMIVPDLPLDETAEYAKQAKRNGIDAILLASPTTSPQRMRRLVRNSSGFLYLVSLLGVTGARRDVTASTLDLVRYAKRFSAGRIPLAVGFGISKPEHVKAVTDAGADAVIVGSGIVDRVAEYEKGEDQMLRNVERYVRDLKAATRAA